jgi:hypothetical protein
MVDVAHDQDGLAAVDEHRRLFCWELLAPCLALSALAFGALSCRLSRCVVQAGLTGTGCSLEIRALTALI